MGEFEDKLDQILNNPQAMSQIMSLAQSLGGASDEQAQNTSSEPSGSSPQSDFGIPLDPQLLSKLAMLFTQYNQDDDHRTALLQALRPFVREQRYAKIDKAIQIAKLSRIAVMALEAFRSKEGDDV